MAGGNWKYVGRLRVKNSICERCSNQSITFKYAPFAEREVMHSFAYPFITSHLPNGLSYNLSPLFSVRPACRGRRRVGDSRCKYCLAYVWFSKLMYVLFFEGRIFRPCDDRKFCLKKKQTIARHPARQAGRTEEKAND